MGIVVFNLRVAVVLRRLFLYLLGLLLLPLSPRRLLLLVLLASFLPLLLPLLLLLLLRGHLCCVGTSLP